VEAKPLAEPEVEVIEDQPEIEIIETPEPQPRVEPPNEANLALQKQIEELRKSEEIQKQQIVNARQERDEALQRTREREAQITKVQKEVYDSQANEIEIGLQAARTSMEKAQSDIETAIGLGDPKAQAEANTRLTIAVRDLGRYEDGKAAIEARAKEPPPQQQNQQELPLSAKDFIGQHPEIMSDPKVNRKARFAHEEIVESGVTAYTPHYFKLMSEYLGYTKNEPEVEVADEPVPTRQKGNSIVSAPVSREVVGSNGRKPGGKVTLTKEEVEFARISGVTPEEYAKQKIKLAEMRASGEYSDQR
jgi:hypothetical protein